MKTSILINNFNYQEYLIDAVNSALEQSVKVDEIILVDDGSTDQSTSIITETYARNERVKLILKEKNEGQLSCLNAGITAAIGDLIFFLDSDDFYEKDYIAECLDFYQTHQDCDFLFCGYKTFGEVENTVLPYDTERDLGYSVIATLYQQAWVGSVTSTLSIRKKILDQILPIPYLEDWRTRADDCLVWGASLSRARKYYIPKALVNYRVHNRNNFYRKKFTQAYLYERELKIIRLFSFFQNKMNYGDRLFSLTSLEFSTIEQPLWNDLLFYLKLVINSDLNLYQKARQIRAILSHFFTRANQQNVSRTQS
jgi:glycosyltransferase involved in cell wall biosynthesis